MNRNAIAFYFDFSSPYSYIASEWIEAMAARHGRTVDWKAILLGATFQAAQLKSPVDHPLKREYSMLDFERSARYAGVPLKMPEKFPIPTQNAARIFWWLHQRGDLSASHWARHCLRAYFARGVFGAPFIFVDGEPFWGNDRLPQVERWLARGPF